MNPKISALQDKIRRLEKELEEEFDVLRRRFEYSVERGRISFKDSVSEYHRRLRKSGFRFVLDARLVTVLVSPVIFAMIVPLVILDFSVWLYQTVCFPAYGIEKVPRSDFIVVDRHHLQYLNYLERLNCLYCGYATGVIGWTRQIAGKTEEYWCPIKHARRVLDAHPLYEGFEDYGDAEGYNRRLGRPDLGVEPPGGRASKIPGGGPTSS